MRVGCFVAVLGLVVSAHAVRAEDAAGPVQSEEKCAVPADDRWTLQEKFVWSRACLGEEADFNTQLGFGGHLDPKKDKFPNNRVLRSRFIETILLDGKYRHALTRRGVRITGALFQDALDLHEAALGHPLKLIGCLFEQGADLASATSPWAIFLDGSQLNGMLEMNALRLGRSLVIKNAQLGEVDLIGAQVRGQINLMDTKVNGKLNLSGLRVDQDLILEHGWFAEVDLTGARLGGQLAFNGPGVAGKLAASDLQVEATAFLRDRTFAEIDLHNTEIKGNLELVGSTVNGPLDMSGLRASRDILINRSALAAVDLIGAQVGGELSLVGATATGTLNMSGLKADEGLFLKQADLAAVKLNGARIGGNLTLADATVGGALDIQDAAVSGSVFLRGKSFKGPIHLINSKVGLNLSLWGGSFGGEVDFTGTHIGAGLLLGAPSAAPWADGSSLTLRNASADAIEGDAWPDRVDLIGFSYRSYHSLPEHSTAWFTDWLAKQQPYSPQPYWQLATVLRTEGRLEDADKILYASRKGEHDQASGWRYWQLTALYWTIGYGYAVQWALLWLLVLLTIGTVIQWWRRHWGRRELGPAVIYSFEMLLPLVRLRGQTREFRTRWFDIYFHIHNVVGLILLAFLAAGLSGLTK